MNEKRKYLLGTAEILEKSQKEGKKYYVNILGRKFIVHPKVFSPKYFNDTKIFAKELPITKGEEFLEIGPGTGVISVFVALKGASKVTAIDINPDAVKNAKENVKLHKLSRKIIVLKGDIFSPLKKGEKFDSIFWNTPFGYTRKKVTMLERAVFDPEYNATKRFIKEAKNHLKTNGRLLIGFSSTLGHYGKLRNFLKEEGYAVKLIAEKSSKEKYPVKFQIYEALLRSKICL